MREVLISILLASAVATPALADPASDRQAAREERSQAREDRQAARETARAERAAPAPQAEPRVERQQSFARPAPEFTPPAQGQGYQGQGYQGQGYQGQGYQRQGYQRQGYAQGYQQQALRPDVDARVQERLQERQQRLEQRQPGVRVVDNPYRDRVGGLRQPVRPVPPVMRNRPPVVSNTPLPGTQPPPRVDAHRSPSVQWNTNWRNDRPYDWQNYRRHHESRFHLGFYYDPFGWGYSQFQIGWRLWPSYYSQRYWLTDPGYYGLPYAPPGYVWVRYWNDALLVDTWSGEVVDAIPGFFW